MNQNFESPSIEDGLNFFPSALEDDPNIYYHATPKRNVESILQNGFKTAKQLRPGDENALESITFNRKSHHARHHIRTRRKVGEDWVILMVKFDSFQTGQYNDKELYLYISGCHPQPEIIDRIEVSSEVGV